MSPAVSVYAFTWECTMNVAQLFPALSQRCHEKSKLIGCAPVQSPRSAVSVEFCCVAPERLGSRVATGACPLADTVPVGLDVADPLPFAFVAVTTTRSVWPTSAEPTVYRKLFAPAIDPQLPPAVSQRSHW